MHFLPFPEKTKKADVPGRFPTAYCEDDMAVPSDLGIHSSAMVNVFIAKRHGGTQNFAVPLIPFCPFAKRTYILRLGSFAPAG